MDDSQYDSWASALGDQNDILFRLIAVKRGMIGAEGGSSTISSLVHCEVQKVLQQPYYSIDGVEGSIPDQKNESRREEEAILVDTILQNEVAQGNATSSRLTALSGR